MQDTPKSERLHIGIFGRRNVGKSSLLNALTGQESSIVSPEAGTTADPVEKPMELLPLGPVVFIDTAGMDDTGRLGAMRVSRTRLALERSDIALLVSEPGEWGVFEVLILDELKKRKIPTLIVFNKSDLQDSESMPKYFSSLGGAKTICTSTYTGDGIPDLKQSIIEAAPENHFDRQTILQDLAGAGDVVVLVIPVDKEAPKGRLILPQAQTIRDALDKNALCMMMQDSELAAGLQKLTVRPRIVITDSQAFDRVAAATPSDILMTSFSIVFSRYKGDLEEQVRGAMAIDGLRPGDRVLVAEACTHHPVEDDIGREKIPRWLTKKVGGELDIDFVRGRDFPEDPACYSLVIHCGACMWNRKSMLSRIIHCRRAGAPITNYGLCIAHCLGIMERALAPFPAARKIYMSSRDQTASQQPTPAMEQ